MSIEAFSAVLHHSKATGSAKVVLLGIAWHYNEDTELGCWPSQQTLANYANITIRQLQRSLKQLVEIGELDVLKHGGDGARFDRLTNRYFILVDCNESCLGGFQHVQPGDIFGSTGRHLRRNGATFKVARGDIDVVLKEKNLN